MEEVGHHILKDAVSSHPGLSRESYHGVPSPSRLVLACACLCRKVELEAVPGRERMTCSVPVYCTKSEV